MSNGFWTKSTKRSKDIQLNNFISRAIGLFTRSDRPASLRRIKQAGRATYAAERAAARAHAVKRGGAKP